jgi:hypothetical protein
VPRYRIVHEDGSDAGEAAYAVWVKPGEMIHLKTGVRVQVLEVLPDENESPFVGTLRVGSASPNGHLVDDH